MGGLGQPRGACRLRNPDRRRTRSVLLRRTRRPSPISAWCRSLPMRGASASMSRPIRACSRPKPRPRKTRRSRTPRRTSNPMPSKPTIDHDGCGLYRAGLSVPADAADRGRDLCRGVQGLRSDAGAICGAGCDPYPSRHRCDAAVGGDRVRPLDARQCDRAAGGKGLYRAQAGARGQARQAALSHQGGRGAAARHRARRSIKRRRGCCSR